MLDQGIGHGFGVRTARRLRHAYLAGISRTVLDVFHTGLDHLGDGAFLGTDLLARNQVARVVHIHERANLEGGAHDTARLGDTPAANKTRQVAREEPMMNIELMSFGPVCELIERQACVAKIGQILHEQTVARRSGKRIDNADLPLGVALTQLLGSEAGGIVRTRNTRRERDVQHVFPLLERRLPKFDVLARAHLGGLGLSTRRDARKELLGSCGLV